MGLDIKLVVRMIFVGIAILDASHDLRAHVFSFREKYYVCPAPCRATLLAVQQKDTETYSERFDRMLDAVNASLPNRNISASEFNVTSIVKPTLPSGTNIQTQLAFFANEALTPMRAFANHQNFVWFEIPASLLMAKGRFLFERNDKLMVRFSVTSADSDADITSVYAVVLNDSVI